MTADKSIIKIAGIKFELILMVGIFGQILIWPELAWKIVKK